MNLEQYLKDADPVALAKAAKTKQVYLTHVARGYSKASYKLAIRIETATGGKVSRHDLRPDIFGKPS